MYVQYIQGIQPNVHACTTFIEIYIEKKEEEDEEEGLIAAQGLYSFINTGTF